MILGLRNSNRMDFGQALGIKLFAKQIKSRSPKASWEESFSYWCKDDDYLGISSPISPYPPVRIRGVWFQAFGLGARLREGFASINKPMC